MKCNCRKDIEAKLLARFKEQAPDATDHQVDLKGYSITLGGSGMSMLPSMEIHASANHPLRNGGSRHRVTKQTMFGNYCPFCGVRAKPKTDSETAEEKAHA